MPPVTATATGSGFLLLARRLLVGNGRLGLRRGRSGRGVVRRRLAALVRLGASGGEHVFGEVEVRRGLERLLERGASLETALRILWPLS